MLLIGSRALLLQRPELLKRNPIDFDFIGTYDEILDFLVHNKSILSDVYPTEDGNKYIARNNKIIYEFEIAWPNSSSELILNAATNDNQSLKVSSILNNIELTVAGIDLLFLIKKSHRFLKNSPHFLKTMIDYKTLYYGGAVIRNEWNGILKLREEETYNYSHPKLNVSKNDFFKDDGISYIYDHDTIHLAMKHLDKPAYEYFKPEDKQVLCSKKMFNEALEETKLFSVLEEAQVLALERSQIPFGNLWPAKKSFDCALMKICTSITSGFWREYAYENYFKIQKIYENDYVDRFWKAVANGIVKKL